MAKTPIAAAVLTMLGVAEASAEDDVWAPARAGKLACFAPDFDRKTCEWIERFTWQPDGTVTSDARGYDAVLLPGVQMKYTSTSTQENQKLCVTPRQEDLANYQFEVDGQPATAEQTVAYREQFGDAFGDYLGRKICLDISPLGGVFVVQFTVDGTEIPRATGRLAFIEDSDGFILTDPSQEE